jgi:thiol:disulfide interchange protein DsbD
MLLCMTIAMPDIVTAAETSASSESSSENSPRTPPQTSGVSRWLKSLVGLSSTAKDDAGIDTFLPVDKAFAFTVDSIDATTLVVRWRITDGYYLYRDKFSFVLADSPAASVASVDTPRGEFKVDDLFGRTEVYHSDIETVIKVERDASVAGPVRLKMRYQGCAEAGYCYPPQTRVVDVLFPDNHGGTSEALGKP